MESKSWGERGSLCRGGGGPCPWGQHGGGGEASVLSIKAVGGVSALGVPISEVNEVEWGGVSVSGGGGRLCAEGSLPLGSAW